MSTDTTSGIALPEFKSEIREISNELVDDNYIVDVESAVYEQIADYLEPTPEKLVKPRANRTDFVRQPKSKVKLNKHVQDDPDKYLLQAKALVVANYNEHRDPRRSTVLNMELVYITWFTKTLGNWKAVVGSSVVRGLLWEVTYNGQAGEFGEDAEAYIDIYKKINHVKIPLG